MQRIVYVIQDEGELDALAQEILGKFFDQRIFLFYGDLGAGKTTFIKAFCRVLAVEDTVQSPSFAIINEYVSSAGPVYHMDFYRLEKEEEAFDIGLEEYLESGNYCFVEWPEKVAHLLPEHHVAVNMQTETDNTRVVEVWGR